MKKSLLTVAWVALFIFAILASPVLTGFYIGAGNLGMAYVFGVITFLEVLVIGYFLYTELA